MLPGQAKRLQQRLPWTEQARNRLPSIAGGRPRCPYPLDARDHVTIKLGRATLTLDPHRGRSGPAREVTTHDALAAPCCSRDAPGSVRVSADHAPATASSA